MRRLLLSMQIYANLPIQGQSGWEKLCRGLLLSLDRLGVQVWLEPKQEWNSEKVRLDPEDASRLNRMARQRTGFTSISACLVQQYPSDAFLASSWMGTSTVRKFCVSLFETDRCPNPWIEKLNRMTGTWVYSEFNKVGWTQSGVKNIDVIPFAVDTKTFCPGLEPLKVAGRKRFAFITNGDFTERKNFEDLIEAFVTEFSGSEDVCLIIKTHLGGFVRRNQREAYRRLREAVLRFNKTNPPRILMIAEKVPETSMGRFYATGDCFILPSRGEGLGLPFAEALACGVPVIAPRWGGQLQFLNDSNSYLIDCIAKQIDDMEYIRKCLHALNHQWAYPSIDTMRQLMRFVYLNPEMAKEKALVGRAQMEARTWQDVALWVIARVFGRVGDVADVVLKESVSV